MLAPLGCNQDRVRVGITQGYPSFSHYIVGQCPYCVRTATFYTLQLWKPQTHIVTLKLFVYSLLSCTCIYNDDKDMLKNVLNICHLL